MAQKYIAKEAQHTQACHPSLQADVYSLGKNMLPEPPLQ